METGNSVHRLRLKRPKATQTSTTNLLQVNQQQGYRTSKRECNNKQSVHNTQATMKSRLLEPSSD